MISVFFYKTTLDSSVRYSFHRHIVKSRASIVEFYSMPQWLIRVAKLPEQKYDEDNQRNEKQGRKNRDTSIKRCNSKRMKRLPAQLRR